MTTEFATLVGRQEEFAVLCGLIGEVETGRGGVVWVEGEPGIGKTALVDAALAAAGSPVRVFRAAGDDLLRVFALRLMAEAMQVRERAGDDARTEIADMLAGRRWGGTDAIDAATERLLDLVDCECALSPVMLVLDDVQWADDASLAACHGLVSVVDQIPLLLVLVARRVPRRAEVDELRQAIARRPSRAVIELTGLSLDNVTAMAAASLSADTGPHLRDALDRAAGNPLYVREMVHVLSSEGLLRIADGLADLTAPLDSGLSSLGAVIGRRLAFLSGPARTTLQSAALLSVRIGPDDLALVTGRADHDLKVIVDEAVAAGVLVNASPWWVFRHPVIRQTLYDEVPSAVRVGLHTHMAKSLAAAGAPWDRVAQHILAGGPRIDGSMLDWLARVPRPALFSLPAVAADLLERGREATTANDPRRALFTTQLTTVLRLLHRQDMLVTVGEMALRTVTDPHLVGEAAWNLATGLGLAGRYSELESVISRALVSSKAVPPWSARLRALRVLTLTVSGRRDEAERQAQLAITEGQRIADPVAQGWALHFLAMTATHHEETLRLIDGALAVVVGDDPDSVDLRLLLHTNRVLTLSVLNRVEEVEAILPTLLALAESAGSARKSLLKWGIAEFYLVHGQWNEAQLYLDQITDVSDATYTLIVHGSAAEIAAHRGDRAAAERHLGAVSHLSYLDGPLRLYANRIVNAEAMLAESDGNPERALALLGGWLSPQNAAGSLLRPEVMRHVVRLALALGDCATAEAAVATAQADTDASGASPEMVEATICRAMVDDDPESLLAVAGDLGKAARPLACAFVLQEAAVRLAQRDDLPAARSAFTRSAAIYDDLEAAWDLRQLEFRLRPYGIRRGPRFPHRRATTGWGALTAAERDVAHRVMLGESNPAIAARLQLSRRTVETHVRHILAKLNVRSRVDIARETAQQETTGGRTASPPI